MHGWRTPHRTGACWSLLPVDLYRDRLRDRSMFVLCFAGLSGGCRPKEVGLSFSRRDGRSGCMAGRCHAGCELPFKKRPVEPAMTEPP
jgi:hypothetical protein